MLSRVKHFLTCRKGNVAFMAAGAAFPLLTLATGALEIAEHNRVKHSMQAAADAAVLSTFYNRLDAKNKGQSFQLHQKIRFANKLFDANFGLRHRVKSLKRKLSGRPGKNRIRMTYQASATIHNMLGDINPLAGSKVYVTASAVYDPLTGKPPRLVSTHFGSVKIK